MTRLILILALYNAININLLSQNIKNNPHPPMATNLSSWGSFFRDPGPYRTAAGPWERHTGKCSTHKIKARLDEEDFRLYGSEWISYHNQSPHELHYSGFSWMKTSIKAMMNFATTPALGSAILWKYRSTNGSWSAVQRSRVNITKVTDAAGNNMPYVINGTMMRIDLPSTLKSKSSVKFFVAWNYKNSNRLTVGGRGGFRKIEDDGNCFVYHVPVVSTMCVYSDFQGWQNKQFTGRAEFALTLGTSDVEMDVPSTMWLRLRVNARITKRINRCSVAAIPKRNQKWRGYWDCYTGGGNTQRK